VAVPLALAALRSLEAKGIRACVVGSLAKGRFSASSDVDFVVDCSADREREAFLLIEQAIGAFPFHMLPADALPMTPSPT